METITKNKKGRLNFIRKWLSKSSAVLEKPIAKENKHEKSIASPEYIKTETENAYLIAIRLPRAEKDSIVVKRVNPVELQVIGKTRMKRDLTDNTVTAVNQYNGMFYLTFDIKPNSDIQRIDANFKNDILTIRIPKLNKTMPDGYRIKIG